MRYIDFYAQFKRNLLIDLRDVLVVFPDFDKRRLNEWQKKGYLIKIASNFYAFSDIDITEEVLMFWANKVYAPSYISLESALSFHGLIPEGVFNITSVSSLKKRNVKINSDKIQTTLSYRKIKRELFFGYSTVKIKNNTSIVVADKEKSLLDFLYFRSDFKSKNDFLELRLEEEKIKEILSAKKLQLYLDIFKSKTLSKKINHIKKIYA
jgi:predicted transcriptional regulator of viral defense system